MKSTHKEGLNIEIEDIPVIRDESSRENSQAGEEKNTKNKYIRKRIKCEQCDKQFNKKETYKVHMRKVHNAIVAEDANFDLVSQACGTMKEIPPNSNLNPKLNVTFQQMLTRQMAKKSDSSSGDQ